MLFFLWNISNIYSQKIKLDIFSKDSTYNDIFNSIKYQKTYNSKALLYQSIDSLKYNLEKKGFLNYKIDTIIKNDSTYVLLFDLKQKINNARLFYSSNNQELIKNIFTITTNNLKEKYVDISFNKLPIYIDQITNTLEKEGNSFAKVALKNISIKNDSMSANLTIEQSIIRKINKIVINGYRDFPKKILHNYLNLKVGTTFNSSKLTSASKLINLLTYIAEIKSPEVLFTKDSTIIYLYLKNIPANKFDGLIGFSTDENQKKLNLNGYLDLSLINLFNNGELLNIQWKNNGIGQQTFDLLTKLPYLFNSKFSLEGNLDIYKQDSSFINNKFKLYVPYEIDNKNSIGLYLENIASSNLLTSSNSNINTFKSIFYGINYKYEILNAHSIFKNKFSLNAEAGFGNRKSENISTSQTKFYLKTNCLVNLNPKNYIFIQNTSEIINLKENLFINELFRLGGFNSIRGFNDYSILSSSYSFVNLEYRKITNESSYIYTITDIGYINNKLANKSSKVYSLGLGYSFKTTFGLLDISYAIGKYDNEAIKINNSKLHLKIVNFF